MVLQLRVLLQGPYNHAIGLMNDRLRSHGVLPVAQPYHLPVFGDYEGTEQVSLDLVQIEGADAMVDWVLVELRDVADPTQILAAKAMMLQRDGDVVDAETGEMTWEPADIVPGDYFVAIRHRNHLDLMTATALPLNQTVTLVDFTLPATAVRGEDSRREANGLALMYAGDANMDQRAIANGPAQDNTNLISEVLTYPQNQFFNANYIVPGYYAADLNMDGNVVFVGPDNDANMLLGNIMIYPTNVVFSANYIIHGSFSGLTHQQ